jgi:predicted ATP-grasp superfamily ATP-dependent carboligase
MSQEHLRWTSQPELRSPVLLAAFEGWNDAGNAATIALRHLNEKWGAQDFASIDPELFYDFSMTRPTVRFDAAGQRQILWPPNTFASAQAVNGDHLDVITLVGVEPQLRWRTFSELVIGMAEHFETQLVLTLGSLLAEVPHSRPVTVFGTAYDDTVIDDLGLLPSRYEGPTGIVGVIHIACRDAGLRSASLWAATPTYLPNAPSPKAALALVNKVAALLHVDVPTRELEAATLDYERQVDEAVRLDEETIEYVSQLERNYDQSGDPWDNAESLVEEVERYLREQD